MLKDAQFATEVARDENGKFVSRKSLGRQRGVIVFSKTDDAEVRQNKMDDAKAQGYNLVQAADGNVELYK